MISRHLVRALLVTAVAASAAARAEAPEKGPQGGHLVDVADRYHLELVADGQKLRLFVTDTKDRKVPVAGATARATVISAGGKSQVELKPAGENELEGSGTFARTRTMKVDLVLTLPGAGGPLVGKFQPLAATADQKHDHRGHKH